MTAATNARSAAEKAFGSDPFNIHPVPKAMIFQRLLFDCRDWIHEGAGLAELPPLHFHVAGANNTQQTLQLHPWAYVLEVQEHQFKYVYGNMPGIGKVPMGKKYTGAVRQVCQPAIAPMEFHTSMHGPVWIFGTPLFYEYQVGYNIASRGISFHNAPCGSCGPDKKSSGPANATKFRQQASFVSEDVTHSAAGKHGINYNPRKAYGEWRETS